MQNWATVGVKSKHDVPQDISQLSERFFFDYFSIKYLAGKHKNQLCSVTQWLKWDADARNLKVPHERKSACIATNKRFVFQPMEISSKVGGDHANAILIDKQSMTAERFEPHGTSAYSMFKDFRYDDLDSLLYEYYASIGITYRIPKTYCPTKGPQNMEHRGFEGYCATFSLWYVDMRLTYSDVASDVLLNQINEKMSHLQSQKMIKNYFLRFVSQVYHLMLSEFPQYHDYFVRFDFYDYRRRKDAGFSHFLAHMKRLVEDPVYMHKEFKLQKVQYKKNKKRRRTISSIRKSSKTRSSSRKRSRTRSSIRKQSRTRCSSRKRN